MTNTTLALQVAELVSRVRNTFSQFAMLPRKMINSSSCRQLEISREAQKTRSDWLIFTKLRCRLRWSCHTQKLGKVEDSSTFHATRKQHFVALRVVKLGFYTRNLSCNLQRNVRCNKSYKKICPVSSGSLCN